MIVLGVDPGTTGAVAAVQGGQLLGVFDMPTLTRKVGKSNRTSISEQLLSGRIDSLLKFGDCVSYIEQVTAMPKQGVSSTMTFGTAYGIARGVLAGKWVPITLLTPQRWRKLVGLKIGGGKDESRQHVMSLFPDKADLFKRAKDHNRADAVLIAMAGVRLEREKHLD